MTKHNSERQRLLDLYNRLKLEANGLRVRKNSAFQAVKKEFGFAGGRMEVHANFYNLLVAAGVIKVAVPRAPRVKSQIPCVEVTPAPNTIPY